MNTPSSDPNNSDNMKDSSGMMHFGKNQVHNWAVYLTLGIIAAVLFVVIGSLGSSYQVAPQSSTTQLQDTLKEPVIVLEKHVATDNLIEKLKYYGMWENSPSHEVPRFFIKNPSFINKNLDNPGIFIMFVLKRKITPQQETKNKKRGESNLFFSDSTR